MKRILLSFIFACGVCSALNLQAETDVSNKSAQVELIDQLLIDQNVEAKVNEHSSSLNGFSPEFLTRQMKANKSLFFETYAVSIWTIDGYSFHIADYYDGTRVVTCLDGELVGLQGIAVNGIKTAESRNVTWYNNYFVHRYPTGKINSYSNKQIIELY